jgi:hypothetical protein
VIEQNQSQQHSTEPLIEPPRTGIDAVDDALLGLADLGLAPLGEHHDRLARAHEVLQAALDQGDDIRSDDAATG